METHSGSHGHGHDAAEFRITAAAAIPITTELATTTDAGTTTTNHATTTRPGVATTTAGTTAATADTVEWTDRVQQRTHGTGNRCRFREDEENSESAHFAGDAEFSRQGNRGAV